MADGINQNPEQIARNNIDAQLCGAGWVVVDKDAINWNAGPGIAVRSYLTQDGKETDYTLFLDRKPVGIIEAKKEEEGHRLTMVEDQSGEYAVSKLKYLDNKPLPFVYESTGTLTRFTDCRDPKPRSRPVFTFHRPETFREWLKKDKSLKTRLLDIPVLKPEGMRDCQIRAITKLEKSFKDNRPRALIQMATGSGKTFAAITSIYRLLKFADAKRILFLVDTRNLGEQAEQEFMAYTPNDDNRKFTELYNVQRLRSSYVASDSQVCISTIQRLYSILKGEELDEKMEEENPAERWQPKEPMPVVYNERIPIEFFDFIGIDECHRSIYNLCGTKWSEESAYRQVAEKHADYGGGDGSDSSSRQKTAGLRMTGAEELLARIRREREEHAKKTARKLKPVKPLTDKELAELPTLPEGWAWVRMGEFAQSTVGYAFKSKEFKKHGVRLLRGDNIEPGRLRWVNTVYWDKKNLKEYRNLLVGKGEVILAMDRPVISSGLKIALAKTHDLPALLVQRVAKITSPNNKFIFLALNSESFVRHCLGNQTGTQLPHISQSQIDSFVMPLCSTEEQHQIVQEIESRLSVCDNIEANIEEALAKSEALRQSILKKAFEGKLLSSQELEEVRRSPDWEPAEKLLERIRAEREKRGAGGKGEEQ